MVHLASDPHVMVGDLSSDVAGPPHPGHIPPGEICSEELAKVSLGKICAESAVNVRVSLLTAVNGSSRLKALASCGLRHNFFLGTGLARVDGRAKLSRRERTKDQREDIFRNISSFLF